MTTVLPTHTPSGPRQSAAEPARTGTSAVFDLDAFVTAMETDVYGCGWSQRSTHGRRSWRHVSEGGFRQRDYQVVPIPHRDAKAFVTTHHYAKTYPAATRRYGLIHDEQLVGVAILGVPMRAAVITNPLPTLDLSNAAELSRLVLLDSVPGNAESWFTTRVFRDAREHGLRAAVAFADPVPRLHVGMPGHVGTVYQAMEAAYCGRGTARKLTVLPDSTVLAERALQKVRRIERGAGGVIRRLVSCGATTPAHGAVMAVWLRRALAEAGARTFAHPGNHRFVFRFGTNRQRRLIPLGEGFDARPYPKRPDAAPTYH